MVTLWPVAKNSTSNGEMHAVLPPPMSIWRTVDRPAHASPTIVSTMLTWFFFKRHPVMYSNTMNRGSNWLPTM